MKATSREQYQGRCPILGCNKVFKVMHWGIDAHINGIEHRDMFVGETYKAKYADFKAKYPRPWPKMN